MDGTLRATGMTRKSFNRSSPVMMPLSDLRRLPAVDLAAARRLGAVDSVQIDAHGSRVAALDIRPAGQSEVVRVAGQRVRRVGHHAIVVTSGPIQQDAPAEVDRWLELRELLGLEVLSDSGDRVGFIADGYVNRESLAIEAYKLDTPIWRRWLRGEDIIMPSDVLACSRELMIVPTQARSFAAMPLREDHWEEPTVELPVQEGEGKRARSA